MAARGTALVTGGSRGIGAAVCVALAADGWDVVVNYASDEAAARDVGARVEAAGGRALLVGADVGDPAAALDLVAQAVAWGAPVTALVNNAGITGPVGRVESLTAEVLGRVLAVNLQGAMLCAAAAVRHMSTRHGGAGGGIVNVSSRAAELGGSGEWVHYAATKGGLETFTVGLAKEVADEGIRVNAVAPGVIDTELHAWAGDPDRVARMTAGVPMQRSGSSEEVAEAVRWLLADASYTTGVVLAVSGGR